MWAKICANTNLEDAILAAQLGADALGFVFAESKRKVTAKQVAQITPHLPEEIETVGVFHNHRADEIAAIVREAGLDTIQLHSSYDLALIEGIQRLLGSQVSLIQTVHWIIDASADNAASIAKQLEMIRRSGATDRVLIDSRVGQMGGGTGISFDWSHAGEIFATHGHGLKIIAAGGLNPGNLAEAIRLMHPAGVDVASGVEATAGQKDPAKLKAFLQIAKS
ncbi:phosphoribosylanthranilate isomerase [Edaphobacter flagellatus]|uniref:phosphoribosylanthranilate isomerase n=1 Tax=Edaphobacter flagellatus TaxID=1933044 RepID=UPI0021B30521|nr:phosphoribosylanthranilate isomerase [Edaphobacter flagellatus]